MQSVLKKSVELNSTIQAYLNLIANGLLLFEKVIGSYLSDENAVFKKTLKQIYESETKADELEEEIKTSLYRFLLLPDARADVLSLIKSLDDIIDSIEEIAKELYIQKPHFPEELNEDIQALTKQTAKTAKSLLKASSAFFNEVHLVPTYIGEVKFFEHEVDIIQDRISKEIFRGDLVPEHSEKMQLKIFIDKIAEIADEVENISAKLTIFTIKREI